MENKQYATLRNNGKYTQFSCKDRTITFVHGKDLIKYLSVVEWDQGYLVVNCMGKVKKEYEDYIDLTHILQKLYMNPESYLEGINEVRIENV